MKFPQLLALLVLFMLSLVIAVAIGSFFSLSIGTTVAALVITIGSGVLLLLIERFILGILRSTSVESRCPMIFRIRNLAIRAGVDNLDIYSTSTSPHNIYSFIGLSKRPVIVVGRNLESALDHGELDALILASLYRIRTGEAQFQTLAVGVSIIFYLPFLLIRGQGVIARAAAGMVMYYHSPFELLRLWLMKNDTTLFQLDDAVARKFEVREELASAYFKIAHLPSNRTKKFSEKIIESFSVADTSDVDGASKLFSFGITMEDRYGALRNIK
ncbi:MAG: hypothetical protein KAG61_02375 [Bacteriovoracaceae bacterium]|nr:hypothetical protein [Bacteriovoracaceae bacterium]